MATPTIENSPAIVKLTFYPGDDLSFQVIIEDGSGTAINLNGYTIDSAITADDITIFPFTGVITDPTHGKVTITMTGEVTSQIVNESKWYFKLISSGTLVKTLMLGPVVLQEV